LWSIEVEKTELKGSEIKQRLETLIKRGLKGYGAMLMSGCYELWRSQAISASQKLQKNFEAIENDLKMALNRKGGTDDRISQLKILSDRLDSIIKSALSRQLPAPGQRWSITDRDGTSSPPASPPSSPTSSIPRVPFSSSSSSSSSSPNRSMISSLKSTSQNTTN